MQSVFASGFRGMAPESLRRLKIPVVGENIDQGFTAHGLHGSSDLQKAVPAIAQAVKTYG